MVISSLLELTSSCRYVDRLVELVSSVDEGSFKICLQEDIRNGRRQFAIDQILRDRFAMCNA